MHLEPESVPQRMAERVAEAAGLNHVPRERVGVAPGHPRPHPSARPPLRGLHHLIQRALYRRRPGTDDHRARDVRAIAVHLSAEV